jgi:hypothetical protein
MQVDYLDVLLLTRPFSIKKDVHSVFKYHKTSIFWSLMKKVILRTYSHADEK